MPLQVKPPDPAGDYSDAIPRTSLDSQARRVLFDVLVVLAQIFA